MLDRTGVRFHRVKHKYDMMWVFLDKMKHGHYVLEVFFDMVKDRLVRRFILTH